MCEDRCLILDQRLATGVSCKPLLPAVRPAALLCFTSAHAWAHPGAPACCTCAAGRRLKRVVPWLGHGLLSWQAPPAQGWGNTLECRARPCLCSLTYRPYDVRVAGWQLGHCFDVGVAAFVGRAARFLGTGHGRHGEGSGWAGTGQVMGGRQWGEHRWYRGRHR